MLPQYPFKLKAKSHFSETKNVATHPRTHLRSRSLLPHGHPNAPAVCLTAAGSHLPTMATSGGAAFSPPQRETVVLNMVTAVEVGGGWEAAVETLLAERP